MSNKAQLGVILVFRALLIRVDLRENFAEWVVFGSSGMTEGINDSSDEIEFVIKVVKNTPLIADLVVPCVGVIRQADLIVTAVTTTFDYTICVVILIPDAATALVAPLNQPLLIVIAVFKAVAATAGDANELPILVFVASKLSFFLVINLGNGCQVPVSVIVKIKNGLITVLNAP